jgi:hypothetical protein
MGFALGLFLDVAVALPGVGAATHDALDQPRILYQVLPLRDYARLVLEGELAPRAGDYYMLLDARGTTEVVMIDHEQIPPTKFTVRGKPVYVAAARLDPWSSALDRARMVAFGPIGRWKRENGLALPPLFAHADLSDYKGDRLAAVDLDGDQQADVVWRMVRRAGRPGPEIERLVHPRRSWVVSARLPIRSFDAQRPDPPSSH